MRCERIVNIMFAYFSFIESGCPSAHHEQEKVVARCAARALSATQIRFASNLFEDVIPFCKLDWGSVALSRGVKHFYDKI